MLSELGTKRRSGARRIRTMQRFVHLLAGVVLLGFVYLTPESGSVLTLVVRWLVFPVVVLTGVAMWQWPRLRRVSRRFRTIAA